MPATDLLYEANLSLGGKSTRRVLVHLVSRAEQSMRIVVSDLDAINPVYKTAGAEFPEHYDEREVGGIEAFLHAHPVEVGALQLAGAVKHGPLTLARAVHAMVTKAQSAPQALATAVDEATLCEEMVLRHQRIVDSFSH